MLMLKNLFENFELAKTALENWEHDENTLESRLANFRISSNAVYPFDRRGKLCFMRLAPTEEKQENNIKGEIEFLDYLKDNNFPSMTPIAADNGEKVIKIQTQWGEYYASVFECVSGKPVENTDYSQHIMSRYGETLGKLHRLSSDYDPAVKKWSHNDALEWAEDTLARYNAPSYMIEECRNVGAKLADLPVDKTTYGLIHYDFEPDNVFYDEKADRCNVIDFDDGMYHFYVLDIEQVFDSLSDELEGEKLKEAKAQFIEGYRSQFPLSDDYEQILPLMRRFCNIFAYARLVRCVAEKPEHQPDWMIGLAERLTYKMRMTEQNVRTIRQLDEREIKPELFESFNRHQLVTKCWRKINEQWVIIDNCFEENWDKKRFNILSEELKATIKTGGAVFGGFERGMLKGFAACEGTPMGSRGQYLELSIIQVSEEMRGSGMGRALFSEIKAWAAAQGAEKLYISAHSSVESQAFYKAMGCVEAEEYSAPHVENEPFDCQMECVLNK